MFVPSIFVFTLLADILIKLRDCLDLVAGRRDYESADHILSLGADLMARLDDTRAVRADRWGEIGITLLINISVWPSVIPPTSHLTVQLLSRYTILPL